MSEEFQIDKDIPPPPSKRKEPHGKWIKLATEMGINDSYLCESRSEFNSLVTAIYRLGFGVISRKQNGRLRVWKIARKVSERDKEGLRIETTDPE